MSGALTAALPRIQAAAAVAAVLVKFRGMTPEQAMAEVRRLGLT